MPTTWISGTSLTAAASATAIAVAGNAQITVASKDLEPSAGILFPVADSMATRVEGGVDCVWDGVHGVLYSSLLTLAFLVTSPWWLLQMLRQGKYRAGLRGWSRLGA